MMKWESLLVGCLFYLFLVYHIGREKASFLSLCVLFKVHVRRWSFKDDTIVLIRNHFQAGSDSAKSLRGGRHNLNAELLRDGGAE